MDPPAGNRVPAEAMRDMHFMLHDAVPDMMAPPVRVGAEDGE